jgi:hypothetical protein
MEGDSQRAMGVFQIKRGELDEHNNRSPSQGK